MVIRTPDQRLRVFVSSTLKELAEERRAAREAILKLRLTPVMFESGARPHPPAELYKSYLAQSQIFVGIYWQSYGWVAPAMSISGLEDEYNLSGDMPSLIYIKKPAPEREAGLVRLLKRIQDDGAGSYVYFSTAGELGELLENDLAILLAEHFEEAGQRPTAAGEGKKPQLGNLPVPRNPLIDREQELAAARDLLLREDVALVTLTGAGGTGKSRLAIEVGLRLRSNFEQGVYLVPLEQIDDPSRVVPAVAEALGIREVAGGRSVAEALMEFLREQQMLLLLDNFEQVIAAAPLIAQLIERSPRVKLLVTSRAPLRIRAERILTVPPLAIPPPEARDDIQQISEYAAVQLFVQRARASQPDFAITPENAPVIADICFRLDGLPLAIELAAARIKMLAPEELLSRLVNRLEVLRGGTRDLPPRQQTLRSAIDWSYRLIDEPGKKLLRRLAVFAGGWTLGAAQRVCDLDGDLGPQLEDALSALLDASLVRLLPAGATPESRFGMLATIREYATEQLGETDECDEVHVRHAHYCRNFIREIEPQLRSAERVRSQAALELEFPNVRSALEWIKTTAKCISIGQQIATGLGFSWHTSGHLVEGEEWCEVFLKLGKAAPPPIVRAALLTWSGELCWARGDLPSGAARLEEALALLRALDDKHLLAQAVLVRAMCALSARELQEARPMFEECIRFFKETNDLWYEAVSVNMLGELEAYEGNFEGARILEERSIELARRQGDPWCLMPPLMAAGQRAMVFGELEQARSMFLEAETILRQTGDTWSLCWALDDLGYVDLMEGHLDQAGTYFLEALVAANTLGNLRGLLISIAGAAAVIAQRPSKGGHAQEQPEEGADLAVKLCGAIAPHVQRSGVFMWLDTKTLYDAAVANVRAQVEAEKWEAAAKGGQRLELDQAVRLAVQSLKD